ncbi:hypothetical protein H1R20_g8613, partial [Candolleomyces eurysporus]
MAGIFNGAHDMHLENATFIATENYVVHNAAFSTSPLKELEPRISAGAMHNSLERCDAPKCHPETRVAVQEELFSWIVEGDNDPEPKRIAWVTGPAGTGKTAIMGTLADRCHKGGLLAACFFFSSTSTSSTQRASTALIPTLAYQLSQHDESLKGAIANALEGDPIIFKKDLRAQMETLLLKPLREVQERIEPSSWPKVIIIDGLDECEAEQFHNVKPFPGRKPAEPRTNQDAQEEILRVLEEAQSDPAFPFRILVASRPERIFRLFFDPEQRSMPFASIVLDEKYKPDTDITLFLEAKFKEIRRKYRLMASWPPQNAIPTLVKNSSGQFVYAATIARFISEARNGNPQVLLDIALKLKPIDTGRVNPFAHLDALYSQILHSSPDPDLVVKWLWFMKIWASQDDLDDKPPPAYFVNFMLEMFEGEADHLLGDVHSLVKVPSLEDLEAPYGFYHKSLFDFLDDIHRSGPLYLVYSLRSNFVWEKYLAVIRGALSCISCSAAEYKF